MGEVYRTAIVRSAATIVAVHNHPSGDAPELAYARFAEPVDGLENGSLLSVAADALRCVVATGSREITVGKLRGL